MYLDLLKDDPSKKGRKGAVWDDRKDIFHILGSHTLLDHREDTGGACDADIFAGADR